MARAVKWRPREIGLGGGYASLATGQHVDFGPDLSGFVRNREDAYALAELFSPVSKWSDNNRENARVGNYVDRCYVDFRAFEPNWLQVKFCVEKENIAFLERLQLVANLHDGWLDADAVKWIMEPDEYREPFAVGVINALEDRANIFDNGEEKVIKELGAKLDLSRAAVLRQALRLYQMTQKRFEDGETLHFSGDHERYADFAGLVGKLA